MTLTKTKKVIPAPKRLQKFGQQERSLLSSEDEGLITPITLIFEPERDLNGQNHPERFTRPVNFDKSKLAANSLPEMSLQGTWLMPGCNRKISWEEWEYIKLSNDFEQRQRRGVFTLIKGIPSVSPTDTLEDYEEADAIEIIRNTYDLDMLELEAGRERRMGVIKAARSQIQSLNNEMRKSISLASDE